jgi:acetate kinase
MQILVVNAGSSSVKLSLLGNDDVVRHGENLPADAADSEELAAALARVRSAADGSIDAVGHRIVHGGTAFSGPVEIDGAVRRVLTNLTALAPLHQPKSLAALDAVSSQLPEVPAVACFDTAFHASLPREAATYAVPREWQERYGVRRYGFHGLSHAYCARRAAEMVGRPLTELRMVTCHLGAGASLAAIKAGRSVDTTMGFTPLEGLVMATRSGTVDPGLVLWLEEHERLSPADVAAALEQRSGLAALAGTADMREVEAGAAAGDDACELALGVYVHRLVSAIAGMAASAGGIDVLAFTAGVGENSARVRCRTAERLGFLGIAVDAAANESASPDQEITAANAEVRTLAIAAREDLQIAHEVRTLQRTTADSQ